ncbi:hypothetical protein jhhlp_005129 [Lomentospora prolificans]|uniref:Beta-xylosidase C-terminal Concanavalin A-like domain-containing protein n=1 Tax=Lomentospora prolificans TaxID=41688 RepID=A0A2N3N7M0_9PEZI|nr:hypothetical protein jhhlp_005129 [Lomentospora prolificans]
MSLPTVGAWTTKILEPAVTIKNPLSSLQISPDLDRTFCLVNPSFHLFPGLPICASKKLQAWEHIGNPINRPEQLKLNEAFVHGFPIGQDCLVAAVLDPIVAICSPRRKFYVTSTNIWADEWSDPVFDIQGIDPSFFLDDGGKAYIQGSWRTSAIQDSKWTSKPRNPSEKRARYYGRATLSKDDVEGPHLYKKDGTSYYLVAAEAGIMFSNHMMTVARSARPWGLFESCPVPLLTAEGHPGSIIQYLGHGDLFQAPSGSWWEPVIESHKTAGQQRLSRYYPLGREMVLVPIEWPSGAWPRLGFPCSEFLVEEYSSVFASSTRLSQNCPTLNQPQPPHLVSNVSASDSTSGRVTRFNRKPQAHYYPL